MYKMGIPSPPPSFIPGLKPSFSANPSHRSLSFSSSELTPRTVYWYFWASPPIFYFFVFLFYTFATCIMVANLALVNPPCPTCPSPSKKKLGSHFIVSAFGCREPQVGRWRRWLSQQVWHMTQCMCACQAIRQVCARPTITEWLCHEERHRQVSCTQFVRWFDCAAACNVNQHGRHPGVFNRSQF